MKIHAIFLQKNTNKFPFPWRSLNISQKCANILGANESSSEKEMRGE
jgi:hypothetical protein